MRIAIFSDFFLPKIDGVALRTANTVRGLSNLGDEVLLFCCTDSNIQNEFSSQIHSLPGMVFPFYPEWKVAIPLPRILQELKKFKPDVIHVICPIFLGSGAIYYAKRLNIPLVISFHTDWAKFLSAQGLAFLRKPVWKLLSYIHNKGDINLTVSKFMIEELEERGFKSLFFWPTGINTSLFNPCKKSVEMRNHLSNGYVNSPLIIFVGRLSPEKNITFIKPIVEALPETRLAIIGDGPQRAALEKIFPKDRTKFLGYLQADEVAAAYASADVMVFPSEFEVFGTVVHEAMASGCPVVAARAGGIKGVLIDYKTGIFSTLEILKAQ